MLTSTAHPDGPPYPLRCERTDPSLLSVRPTAPAPLVPAPLAPPTRDSLVATVAPVLATTLPRAIDLRALSVARRLSAYILPSGIDSARNVVKWSVWAGHATDRLAAVVAQAAVQEAVVAAERMRWRRARSVWGLKPRTCFFRDRISASATEQSSVAESQRYVAAALSIVTNLRVKPNESAKVATDWPIEATIVSLKNVAQLEGRQRHSRCEREDVWLTG